jgi:hypothetical protein
MLWGVAHNRSSGLNARLDATLPVVQLADSKPVARSRISENEGFISLESHRGVDFG